MRNREDTIAAIATAQGEGGIAIVRVSGPDALKALEAVFTRQSAEKGLTGVDALQGEARTAGALEAVFARQSTEKGLSGIDALQGEAHTAGALEAVFTRQSAEKGLSGIDALQGEARTAGWTPNRLYYGHVVEDGRIVDEAMVVYMAAPRSYTREDVCELHVHGGRYAAEKALSLILRQRVRAAEPGEFTLRAFLNGRIDLSQAEAVMAMISAGSASAARAAARQLEGSLGAFVNEASRELTDMLALIEANVDFPEEVDEAATSRELESGIRRVRARLLAAVDERTARIIRDGLTVAIAGAPNAGKSSLMNAMLKSDRAIVTSVPGTTRDVLSERLRVGGLDVTLLDTAGIRETRDEIEREGVARARRAADAADAVLLVVDGAKPEGDAERALLEGADERYIVVLSKCDLGVDAGRAGLRASAKTGEGIDEILKEIMKRAGSVDAAEERLTQPRHIDCAKAAVHALDRAMDALLEGVPPDLVSVDLMAALSSLHEITGQSASDEVIAAVFRNFCVGK